MSKKKSAGKSTEVDLFEERQRLEHADPVLVRSYQDFVSSFQKFREIEAGYRAATETTEEPTKCDSLQFKV